MPPDDLGTTIHSKVRGTTVMGSYGVQGGRVLLTSSDFGDASAGLDGAELWVVAERLLHELPEAAMARSGKAFLRDDELSASPQHHS